MQAEPESPPPDPEIEALLHFTPVHRRCARRGGWSAETQRGFIAALARCGRVGPAAHQVGGTLSGAYKVRTAGGADQFAQAWDKAVDLFNARNPRPPRAAPARASAETAPQHAHLANAEAAEQDVSDETWTMFTGIMEKYLLKLHAEREARVAGRIVEADFYVRQLSWLEVVLDLGGRSHELLLKLQLGSLHPGRIAATPMSLLLDQARRAYWAEGGEPERPPLGDLGVHDEGVSTGPSLAHYGGSGEDGAAWQRRREAEAEIAAQAQALWEEKARTEAQAWSDRLAAEQDQDASDEQPQS